MLKNALYIMTGAALKTAAADIQVMVLANSHTFCAKVSLLRCYVFAASFAVPLVCTPTCTLIAERRMRRKHTQQLGMLDT